MFLCSFGKDSSVILHGLKPWLDRVLVVFIDCGGLYPDIEAWAREKGSELPHFAYVKTPGDIWEYIDANGFPLDVDVPELGRFGKILGADEVAQKHKIQPWTNCIYDRFWVTLNDIIKRTKPDLLITGEHQSDRPVHKWTSFTEDGSGIKMTRPIFDWTDEDVWEYIDFWELELTKSYQGRQKERRDCWLCLGHDITAQRVRELREDWPHLYHRLFEEEGLREVLGALEGHLEHKIGVIKGINEVIHGAAT